MSNDLRMSILKGANDLELEDQAIKAGMTTLEQSGILSALRGLTTLKEVYRVARPME
jgi:type II secretory ATPase GspE/PulE/Tfp pilus assembly ATPase PilB-like protein